MTKHHHVNRPFAAQLFPRRRLVRFAKAYIRARMSAFPALAILEVWSPRRRTEGRAEPSRGAPANS